MKNLAGNRLLWAVLGVVFVAMIGFGAVSSQMSSPTGAPASSAAPTVSASAAPQDSATAKPYLADYQDPQPQSTPNTLMTVVGLVLKLGVVIGLVYMCVLVLRFFGNRGRKAFLGETAINVLEKTALAQNRELYLVDIADRVLLLGATSNSIALLTEITDAEAVDGLRNRPQPALPSAEPFLNYLKNVGEKVSAEVANVTPLHPADVLKRIESHRDRIRERTAALQGNDA
ncbi:MAG TPA: flagellar biosynthetic protein FliO [Chloroflexota bacterium]